MWGETVYTDCYDGQPVLIVVPDGPVLELKFESEEDA